MACYVQDIGTGKEVDRPQGIGYGSYIEKDGQTLPALDRVQQESYKWRDCVWLWCYALSGYSYGMAHKTKRKVEEVDKTQGRRIALLSLTYRHTI
jgi:hypothetical protein